MATKIGVWDPLSGRLPNLKDDITFAQFYVQNDGEDESLGLSFKIGEWLVYIVDDNNEPHWYKSSSGMVTVSSIGNTNAPESNWYTKIFINANGQITGGDILAVEDLPAHTHAAREIEYLDDSVWTAVATIFQTQKFNNQGNVEFLIDEKLKKITARVIVDEETIGTNEFGQLYVMAMADGGQGGGGNTADLDAIRSDIENLKIEIQNKFKGYVLDVNDIPIDEQTITINNAGQLQATAMKNQKHTHVMSDIEDLPEHVKIAAKNQQLSLEIDSDVTAINISGETIEKSFILINEYMKKLTESITVLQEQSGKIQPSEPNNISYSTYTVDNFITKAYDKYKNEVDVYIGPYLKVSSVEGVYPPNKGLLQVKVDGSVVESIDLSKEPQAGNIGNFSISYKDSYEGNPNYTGFYKSLHFTWTSYALPDTKHTIQIAQVIGPTTYESQPFTVNTVSKISNMEALSVETASTVNEDFVSGIPCSKKELVKIQATWKFMYNQDFYPINFLNSNGDLSMYFDKNIMTVDVTQSFNGTDSGTKSIYLQLKDYETGADVFKEIVSTGNIRYDNTIADVYRYVWDEKKETYEEYNPKDKLPTGNAIILNSILQATREDYSYIDGPDYTDNVMIMAHGKECQEAVFCFDCPDFVNNFYVDIVDRYNNSLSTSKTGIINGLNIDACLTNSYNPEYWASTYRSYDGNSNVVDDSTFGALDLFRSTAKRKWITFGKQPNIKPGRLFVRFLIENGYNINIDKAVTSIVESLTAQIGG